MDTSLSLHAMMNNYWQQSDKLSVFKCADLYRFCYLLIGNIWASVLCILYIVFCTLSGLLLDLLLARFLNQQDLK